MVDSAMAVDETPQAEGDAVAESAPDTPLNIYQRVHAIRCAVGGYIDKDKTQEIRKDGRKVGQFDYITHDNVTNHIRKAMNDYGVLAVPNMVSHAQNGNRCEIVVNIDFINVDNPADRLTMQVLSHGVDSQDKGPGKALSYAMKMAELKLFMLNSADDIEADTTEHQPTQTATAADVERAEGRADNALHTAAEALRAALKGCQTLEDLDNFTDDPNNKAVLRKLPKDTQAWFAKQVDAKAASLGGAA